jgi:sigma-B regulation protein RsbU (phosphoserine phosphatase)
MMDVLPIILLVDDDPTALNVLGAILRQEGLEALSAATVQEAQAMAASESFDLAILDVKLPDGNGLDLCRWMKNQSRHADVPVLILSSDDDVRTKVAGFEAGATDYVTKPFHRAEVLARVKTQLRLHKAYRSVVELQALKLARLTDAQQAMLPQPERMPEAKFRLYYEPLHEAGGDLCQVFQLGRGLHDYMVADVCGHDIGTAMTTAALQALMAQNCTALYSPVEILRIINRVACSIISEGQYITTIYARLNRQTKRLTLVSAAHPPAILQRRNGELLRLQMEGDVLGVFESAEFGSLEVAVEPGDRIFLFSDALVEGTGPQDSPSDWEAGMEKIMQTCGTLADWDLRSAVTGLACQLLGDDAPRDDVTILGIEV